MKKTWKCDSGGYKALRRKLLDKEEIQCELCLKMLKKRNFNRLALDQRIENPLDVAEPDEAEQPQDTFEDEGDEAQEMPADMPADKDSARKKRKVEFNSLEDLVLSFQPHIELLPPGSFKKALPFRCKLCTSRKWKSGRVGDLVSRKIETCTHFLMQHVESLKHQRGLAGLKTDKEVEVLPCQGLLAHDPTARAIHKYLVEFDVWASVGGFDLAPDWVKHKYTWESQLKTWRVRHSRCTGSAPAHHSLPAGTCGLCFRLGDSHSVVRTAQSFAVRYFMAELLHARLFLDEESRAELEQKIRKTSVWETGKCKIHEIFPLPTAQLQQWVRASWCSNSKLCSNAQRFFDQVVAPSLACNMATVPERLSEVVASLTNVLKGQDCSEEQMAQIKLASGVLRGSFENHPLVMGITLQCLRLCDRQSEGKSIAGPSCFIICAYPQHFVRNSHFFSQAEIQVDLDSKPINL